MADWEPLSYNDEPGSNDADCISDSEIFPHGAAPAPKQGLIPLQGALNPGQLQDLRQLQVTFVAEGCGGDRAAAEEVLAHNSWSFPEAVLALGMPSASAMIAQTQCPVCMDSMADLAVESFEGCHHWLHSECFSSYVLSSVTSTLSMTAGAAVCCPECVAEKALRPGLVGEKHVKLVLESLGQANLFDQYLEGRKRLLPRYQTLCPSAACQCVVRPGPPHLPEHCFAFSAVPQNQVAQVPPGRTPSRCPPHAAGCRRTLVSSPRASSLPSLACSLPTMAQPTPSPPTPPLLSKQVSVPYDQPTSAVTVDCSCGMRFCFSCRLPEHQPATCAAIRIVAGVTVQFEVPRRSL